MAIVMQKLTYTCGLGHIDDACRVGPNALIHADRFSAIKWGGRPQRTAGAVAVALSALLLSGCATAPNNLNSNLFGLGKADAVVTNACGWRGPILNGSSTANRRSKVVFVPPDAASAIRYASRVTRISADYLALTAYRESAFRSSIAARKSSAVGMYQFIEQTWLGLLYKNGNCLGLGHLTKHIYVGSDGRYFVRDRNAKRKILNLRKQTKLSAVLAGRLAQLNAKIFSNARGRTPSIGELYTAHFLGAVGAAKLSKLRYERPNAPAKRFFSRAANANPSIFYDRKRPRTVAEVFDELVRKHVGVRVQYGGRARQQRSSNPGFIDRLHRFVFSSS